MKPQLKHASSAGSGRDLPFTGMTLAFASAASTTLAGIPARVTRVWPRLLSGDYLVSLEYAQPVSCKGHLIRHIDARLSDLVQTGD